jgi:tetratricopeptide (TPR) repeat protein
MSAKVHNPRGATAAGASGRFAPRKRELIAAGLLLLTAAVLRIWSVAVLSRDPRISSPILDGRYYLDLARRLAAGRGWPAEPFFMTPLYPSVLSFFFQFGPRTVLTVQVFQSVLGVGALALLVLAVNRDFGRRAAWGAAVFYVLCGPILAMESQVLTESLLLFLAAGALWLWPAGPAPVRRPRLRWILFGLACGLLTVGRGTFLLLPLFALGHMLVRRRMAALRGAAWVALGLAVALVPVVVHQTRTTGHLALTTLNGGLNLYVGNNPVARGRYSSPGDLDIEADFTAVRSASIATGRTLSMEESSRYWQERAVEFLQNDPWRALALFGRKALLYISPREIPQIEVFDLLRRSAAPLRVAFVDFAWIFPAAVWGGVVAARSGRRRGAAPPGGPATKAGKASPPELPGSAVPWLSLIAAGWISTIIFFATGRYRIPFLAGFLGLAALGVSDLARRLRQPRLEPALLVIPLAAALQWAVPSYSLPRAEAHDVYQQARRLSDAGQDEEALRRYQESLRLDPGLGAAWHGVGYSLLRLGRASEAVTALGKAIEAMPGSAETYTNLGAAYWQAGERERAIEAFRRAVALDPYDPTCRSNLDRALSGGSGNS